MRTGHPLVHHELEDACDCGGTAGPLSAKTKLLWAFALGAQQVYASYQMNEG